MFEIQIKGFGKDTVNVNLSVGFASKSIVESGNRR